MMQVKTYIEQKSETNILVRWLYHVALLFKTPYDAIKNGELSKLYNKNLKNIYLGVLLSCAIYLLCLKDVFMPVIIAFLTIMISIILEAAEVVLVLPMKRYDTSHKIMRSIRNPYGKNRFMSKEDEKAVFDMSRDINNYKGIILGLDEYGNMVSKIKDLPFGNNNMFVCGNSGTKKGVGIVIPRGLQLIAAGVSGVIASTKDDNYAILAPIARANGYIVKALTLRPGELTHSDGIDLMKIVNGSTDMAQALAACFIKNTSLGEKPDYWYRGEQSLLFSLILMFSLKHGTLADVYEFLCENNLEQLEAIMDMLPKEHPAYGPYKIFKGGKETPKAQVLQGLGMRFTSFMADSNIRQILSNDEININQLGEKKCLYFVIVSDKTDQYKALSSSFFSLMFFSLGILAENNGGCLKKNIEVIIDEAFACGTIPGYAGIIATARGYGINVTTILQNIPQLRSMYPDTYESILNDSGIKVLVHTDDPMTAEYFSTLLGTFTGMQTSKNAKGEISTKDIEVPLMSAGDILNKDINKQIVYISGAKVPAIILKKQLYYSNWPGSKFKFYNNKEERCYNSHPLLKDFKYTPLNKHRPEWQKQSKQSNTKQVNDVHYTFEDT